MFERIPDEDRQETLYVKVKRPCTIKGPSYNPGASQVWEITINSENFIKIARDICPMCSYTGPMYIYGSPNDTGEEGYYKGARVALCPCGYWHNCIAEQATEIGWMSGSRVNKNDCWNKDVFT